MKKKNLLNYQPMNLQFFAENPTGVDDNTKDDTVQTNESESEKKEEEVPQKTYEDALAEIAAAQAEAKKAKADRDAALKKSGELTKQLRAKMSEDELKAQQNEEAEAERNAHIKELEDYKAQNEAFKRYTMQGMSAELATKAANAELAGDMDALADAFKEQKNLDLKAAKAQWLGSRPEANKGDEQESSMTREEIFAIKDPIKRQAAIARNLKQFEQKRS